MEASSDHCLGFSPAAEIRFAFKAAAMQDVQSGRYSPRDHMIIMYVNVNMCGLTCQLCSDSLEWQLPELLDQRSELGAADQLVSTVVQLVRRHKPVVQNSFH